MVKINFKSQTIFNLYLYLKLQLGNIFIIFFN